MDKNAWIRKIKSTMKQAGTYEKRFDPVVTALAEILEQRDRAYDEFIATGAQTVVDKVSDRGSINKAKNPLLQMWLDLNASALSYWKELGLTPAGLKRINDEALRKKEEGSALETALIRLSNGA